MYIIVGLLILLLTQILQSQTINPRVSLEGLLADLKKYGDARL